MSFCKTFSGVLELDLDHVEVGISAGNVIEPVVTMQLASRSAFAAAIAFRALGASVTFRQLATAFVVKFFCHSTLLMKDYLAKLTERVSRITVIFTWPG